MNHYITPESTPRHVAYDIEDLTSEETAIYRAGYAAGHGDGVEMGAVEEKHYGFAYTHLVTILMDSLGCGLDEARAEARKMNNAHHYQEKLESIIAGNDEVMALINTMRDTVMKKYSTLARNPLAA